MMALSQRFPRAASPANHRLIDREAPEETDDETPEDSISSDSEEESDNLENFEDRESESDENDEPDSTTSCFVGRDGTAWNREPPILRRIRQENIIRFLQGQPSSQTDQASCVETFLLFFTDENGQSCCPLHKSPCCPSHLTSRLMVRRPLEFH